MSTSGSCAPQAPPSYGTPSCGCCRDGRCPRKRGRSTRRFARPARIGQAGRGRPRRAAGTSKAGAHRAGRQAERRRAGVLRTNWAADGRPGPPVDEPGRRWTNRAAGGPSVGGMAHRRPGVRPLGSRQRTTSSGGTRLGGLEPSTPGTPGSNGTNGTNGSTLGERAERLVEDRARAALALAPTPGLPAGTTLHAGTTLSPAPPSPPAPPSTPASASSRSRTAPSPLTTARPTSSSSTRTTEFSSSRPSPAPRAAAATPGSWAPES